ncbi:MAG: tetratricopeptide repeat protein, partial [Blastocatellia bacterium]
NEQRDQGKIPEALPFYQRAVELDPNFALAWAGLASVHGSFGFGQRELAAKAAEKALSCETELANARNS